MVGCRKDRIKGARFPRIGYGRAKISDSIAPSSRAILQTANRLASRTDTLTLGESSESFNAADISDDSSAVEILRFSFDKD